jgi:hypothetical protein
MASERYAKFLKEFGLVLLSCLIGLRKPQASARGR